MDYFITKKIAEPGRGETLQRISGPYRTVTQLVEALDTLLNHYARTVAAKRYVWWIEERTLAEHNLILEELPPSHMKW